MTGDPTLWLLARASGVVAYGLLTAVVLLGIVVKARPLGALVRPAALTDLHRFAAVLSLGALAVHGTALVLDRAVDIRLVHLLVPGIAPYRPLWAGLGVVAAELMIVVSHRSPSARGSGRKRGGRSTGPRMRSSRWRRSTVSRRERTTAGPGRSPSTAAPWERSSPRGPGGSSYAGARGRQLPDRAPPTRLGPDTVRGYIGGVDDDAHVCGSRHLV